MKSNVLMSLFNQLNASGI